MLLYYLWIHYDKIHIVIHKMETASQKETSPLDRKAINSLPHKSSAFVPQCLKNGSCI